MCPAGSNTSSHRDYFKVCGTQDKAPPPPFVRRAAGVALISGRPSSRRDPCSTGESAVNGAQRHRRALDLELGRSAADRRAYRALFGPPLDAAFLDALRAATNGEWAFGGEGFKRQIATALTRRVAPLPKGRRRNATADARQTIHSDPKS